MSDGEVKVKKSAITSFIVKVVTVFLLVALTAVSVAYVVITRPQVLGLSKNSDQRESELDQVVFDVSKLMMLPTDEQPTLATVTDVEKVKNQTFFKDAQNGDKLLVYSKTRKAILFRPSENKIIDVGALTINQASPKPSDATPSATIKATSSPKPATP